MPVINSLIVKKGSSNSFCKQFAIDANNKAYPVNNIIDFSGVEDVANGTFLGLYKRGDGYRTLLDIATLDLSSLIHITGDSAFDDAFYNTYGYSKIDMSNLVYIGNSGINYSCRNMFYIYYGSIDQMSLQEVDLRNLEAIDGYFSCSYMFFYQKKLTTINFSKLKTIGVRGSYCCNHMFNSCTNLETIDLSALEKITNDHSCCYMFSNCSKLANVDLSSLEEISGDCCLNCAFNNCTSLTTLSFPALKSSGINVNRGQFGAMLNGVTGCTVHFPSNLQAVIGSWGDVANGFGGINTTVLFDLPATE